MRGAIPPLPNTLSWPIARLKKAQGQLCVQCFKFNKLLTLSEGMGDSIFIFHSPFLVHTFLSILWLILEMNNGDAL
jgi:hypothetical protein